MAPGSSRGRSARARARATISTAGVPSIRWSGRASSRDDRSISGVLARRRGSLRCTDAREYRKCHWECIDEVEQKFSARKKKGDAYAAFVFEPLMQGAAGTASQVSLDRPRQDRTVLLLGPDSIHRPCSASLCWTAPSASHSLRYAKPPSAACRSDSKLP